MRASLLLPAQLEEFLSRYAISAKVFSFLQRTQWHLLKLFSTCCKIPPGCDSWVKPVASGPFLNLVLQRWYNRPRMSIEPSLVGRCEATWNAGNWLIL